MNSILKYYEQVNTKFVLTNIILAATAGYLCANLYPLYGGAAAYGKEFSPGRMSLVPGHIIIFLLVRFFIILTDLTVNLSSINFINKYKINQIYRIISKIVSILLYITLLYISIFTLLVKLVIGSNISQSVPEFFECIERKSLLSEYINNKNYSYEDNIVTNDINNYISVKKLYCPSGTDYKVIFSKSKTIKFSIYCKYHSSYSVNTSNEVLFN